MARTATKGRKTRKSYNDENDFLMGGEKVPSASFLTKGTSHEGEILRMEKRQQTDVQTRKPLFWDNGDPRMQLMIELQTEEYDEDEYGEDDDGRRRLYVKFKMRDAIRDAVAEAGADDGRGLEVGGYLKITFTKQDKPENRTKSGIKHFEAEYTPPDPDAQAAAMLDDDDPDEDDYEEEKPAPRKRPAKKSTSTNKRRRSEPEPEDEDEDEDDEDDEDEPPRRRPAKKAAKKSAGARSRRSRYVEDDDEDDDEDAF